MSADNFQIELESLPSPPSVAISLLDLFGNPDACLDDLANIIRIDPALSARIIAYCNSPLMGLPRKVDSIDRATIVLGMNSVRMIALSFSLVEIQDESDFDFERFWNQSLAFAVSAQTICRFKRMDGDFGFLVGLMLNIGEIAIYRDANKATHEALKNIDQTILSIAEFEKRELGTNRFDVGATVLENWCFPTEISSAIQRFGTEVPARETLEMSISCGWGLASLFANTTRSVNQIETMQTALMENLGVDAETLDAIFLEAQDCWLAYASLLNLDNEWSTKSLRDLENAARMRLTSFSISQCQDQHRIQQENELLKSCISKDALTGVNNRGAYNEQAMQAFSRCQRSDRAFSLIIIDIDNFKRFNDDHGHQIGDEALKHVAKMLIGSLRDYDSLFRYGGEEFVVILPESDQAQALRIGERLRQAVCETPFAIESKRLPITVSVGISTCKQTAASTLDLVFEVADSCLYKAKENGRNCCVASEDVSLV